MSNYPIQSARNTAYRALCLGTLLKRSALEQGMHSVDDLPDTVRDGWKREHEGIHQHLKKWIVDEKLVGYFSSDERLLIDAELGDWQQLDTAQIYWRCESLGVLLWAMDVVDTPYYDTQFNVEALLDPLDLMSPTIDFIWQASLRPPIVLHQARDLAEKWQWRAQIYKQQQNAESSDKRDEIKQVAHALYTQGNLPDVIDDDFPVLGKAYAQLTSDEFNSIAPIAQERYFALTWLCQAGDDWGHSSIET